MHFDVDGDDYFVDMLFFHMHQNRFNCTRGWRWLGEQFALAA